MKTEDDITFELENFKMNGVPILGYKDYRDRLQIKFDFSGWDRTVPPVITCRLKSRYDIITLSKIDKFMVMNALQYNLKIVYFYNAGVGCGISGY